MTRVKTGPTRRRRHKKVLKNTKGYRMTKGRLFKVSKEAQLHAGQYAFAGRKLKKRQLRRLWIQRINAGLTPLKVKYSQFIAGLKKAKISINRKMLAELAISQPKIFSQIVKKATK